MKILDIGCGNNKYTGPTSSTVIGMDIVSTPSVDLVHDMESFPYPFGPSSFDQVVMTHSLEHVSKENQTNIKIIEEIYRILRPNGLLIVQVPLGHSFNYDPTHKNPVPFWYWKYFSNKFYLNYYTHARFSLISSTLVSLHGLPLVSHLTAPFNTLYYLTPPGAERLLSFLHIDMEVQYILKKDTRHENSNTLL